MEFYRVAALAQECELFQLSRVSCRASSTSDVQLDWRVLIGICLVNFDKYLTVQNQARNGLKDI